jgi:hypothetical protein
MTLESLLFALVWVVIIVGLMCLFGMGARWIIQTYFPEPMRMIAMAIVGVILLIVLILLLLQFVQGGVPAFRLKT